MENPGGKNYYKRKKDRRKSGIEELICSSFFLLTVISLITPSEEEKKGASRSLRRLPKTANSRGFSFLSELLLKAEEDVSLAEKLSRRAKE